MIWYIPSECQRPSPPSLWCTRQKKSIASINARGTDPYVLARSSHMMLKSFLCFFNCCYCVPNTMESLVLRPSALIRSLSDDLGPKYSDVHVPFRNMIGCSVRNLKKIISFTVLVCNLQQSQVPTIATCYTCVS